MEKPISRTQDDGGNHPKGRPFPLLRFLSTILFVIGSILYMALALEDHRWGRTLRRLPIWLRTADDDLAWVNYRLEERYNETLTLPPTGGDGERWLQYDLGEYMYEERVEDEEEAPTTSTTNDTIMDENTAANLDQLQEQGDIFDAAGPTPEELYYDEWWADLPLGIKYSYTVLGMNETMWNEGQDAPTNLVLWDNLTPEQQEAALFIGYTREGWDADIAMILMNETQIIVDGEVELEEDTLLAPTDDNIDEMDDMEDDFVPSVADSNATLTTGTANNETHTVEDYMSSHINLTSPVPVTAVPTTKPTAAPSPAPTPAPSPKPTSAPVQPATPPPPPPGPAPVATPRPTPRPTPAENIVEGPTPEELYYDEWWADLPPAIQDAYAILGYDENIWNNGLTVPVEDLWWDKMTPEQIEAATFIGYTRLMWNGDPTTAPTFSPIEEDEGPIDDMDTAANENATVAEEEPVVEEVPAPEQEKEVEFEQVEAGAYDDEWWRDLPPHIQDAAATLGYDEGMWDSGGFSYVKDLWFDELTPDQQEAAKMLGYDEYTWNEVDPLTGESTATGDDYVSYDDDYVFEVKSTGTFVSRYMILYFSAALCFVFVGVLDLIREKRAFHLLMIIAGGNGVVSAMLEEKNIHVSNILNSVSVHFFLLEAFTLFGEHRRAAISTADAGSNFVKGAIAIADGNFLLGSLVDVVLSYIWIFDDTADWNTGLAITSIVASCMWLVCALIYLWAFFYEYKRRNEEDYEYESDDDNHDVVVPNYVHDEEEIKVQATGDSPGSSEDDDSHSQLLPNTAPSSDDHDV